MARLKALGIWVPTFPFCAYHDDGYVNSMVAHAKSLSMKYGIFVNPDMASKAAGMIVEGGGILRTNYHIFYLNKGDREFDIRNRAHEETHFLEMRGFLNKLERRLLEEQGARINFSSITVDDDDVGGKEVIAHIGGIYALVKNGLDHNAVISSIEAFNYARNLYNKSRIAA